MIDHTTVQTFPVPPPLTELEKDKLLLVLKNKRLKGWLIAAVVTLGIGMFISIIRKNVKEKKSNGKKVST